MTTPSNELGPPLGTQLQERLYMRLSMRLDDRLRVVLGENLNAAIRDRIPSSVIQAHKLLWRAQDLLDRE